MGSMIISSDLTKADLTGANLTNSIIIASTLYDELELGISTKFNNVIIDDPAFLKYIGKYASNLPQEKIENKRQLKEKLKQLSIDDTLIQLILNVSKLHEE